VTDVASGWTESAAVINKAQVWVFAALKKYPRPAAVPVAGHRFGQWLGIHQ